MANPRVPSAPGYSAYGAVLAVAEAGGQGNPRSAAAPSSGKRCSSLLCAPVASSASVVRRTDRWPLHDQIASRPILGSGSTPQPIAADSAFATRVPGTATTVSLGIGQYPTATRRPDCGIPLGGRELHRPVAPPSWRAFE